MKLKRLLEELQTEQSTPEQRLQAPDVAYLPPSEGPFKCGNCEYFKNGHCHHKRIQAPVEAEGCCNLYEKR